MYQHVLSFRDETEDTGEYLQSINPPTLAELQACQEAISSQIEEILKLPDSTELQTMYAALNVVNSAISEFHGIVAPVTLVGFSYPPTFAELEACRLMVLAKTALEDSEKVSSLLDKVSKVVMVADSDIHVRKLLSRYLIEAGYTVTFASDGNSAFESARQSPPLAILADMLLPKLDGLALCRLIKGDPATENRVTVIVFSVLAAEESALKAGADAFILKPLEKIRLLKILEEAKTKRNLVA